MRISEYFYSLQGEGTHAGQAFIFIRFTDCDLTCSFCDEEKHKEAQYQWSIPQLIKNIRSFPAKRICLTGGEPSLEDRNPLIVALQERGYFVAVETNGYQPENIQAADWITYSPKRISKINYGPWFDEMKLLVTEQVSLNEIQPILAQVKQPFFLQPITLADPQQNLNSIHHARDLILREPRLRLSLQIQHWIQIP